MPSAVSNITAVSINSTSLWLSWQQPKGDVDELIVLVSSSSANIWEKTLHPNAVAVSVDQLTPGSAYQVVVKSRSGSLTNQSEIRITKGETARQKGSLFFCAIVTSSFLSCLQLQRQRPSSPCPRPPPAASSSHGCLLLVTGRTTAFHCPTAPSRYLAPFWTRGR